MHKYIVTNYGVASDKAQVTTYNPVEILAVDAIEAIRAHPAYSAGGAVTHRLGGAEMQAHWQLNPRQGTYGIEAIHASLDVGKVTALSSIKLHDDRRETALHMIDA